MERARPELVASFARVLQRHRKNAGLSQEELGFRTNLSMSYISLMENRKRQPTLAVLDVLCRELQITMTDFVAEVEQQTKGSKTP